MARRQVLFALSGLLLGIFVSILATTVVSSALPTIVTDLDGSQSVLTWIVVSEILAMTVSVPLWGSCADVIDHKRLVHLALAVFVAGSLVAALAGTWEILVAGRIMQGVGAGGLTALVQIVLASIVSARDLGRYQGVFGAVFTVAAVSGPLLGGLLVSAPWLGWRWCFWSAVPLAVSAAILLQRTLPSGPAFAGSRPPIDWGGAALVTVAVCVLLIWVTLAGHRFAWWSWPTTLQLGAFGVLFGATIWQERRAPVPVLPLSLVRDRTILLATVASIPCGMAMFGSVVFLSQWLQEGRGLLPVQAGLMSLPLIVGLLAASTMSGQHISRTGKWKRHLVAGGLLMQSGAGLVGAVGVHSNSLALLAVLLVGYGIGIGLLMQNLVLAAQNVADPHMLGVTTSFVSFTRALGGSVGVTVLGSVLAHGARNDGAGGIGLVFLIVAAASVVTLVLVLFIRETPLRTESGAELRRRAESAAPATTPATQTPVL